MSVWLPLAGVLAVAALAILSIWRIPKRQTSSLPSETDRDKVVALENELRKTIAQIVGGVVILLGLFFSWQELVSTKEKLFTENFSRAVAQLGDDQTAVRVGGVYALERIARGAVDDHWTVMEMLAELVRNEAKIGVRPPGELPSDVQAALTVIGRREEARISEESEKELWIDLSGTDLGGAKLKGASLPHVNLSKAHLEWADFRGANLWHADFTGAHLEHASFDSATLRETKFQNATTDGAVFDGADLREAKITDDQLAAASTDSLTRR